jgi:ArsR family transcriptional regulator, cadmium/lead-responsive transcriptional repressor
VNVQDRTVLAENTGASAAVLTARFFTGLADPTRLRIVELLLGAPHTVGAIVTRLGLRQARVSNALVCLKWCGYVEARREGRYVWYAVTDPRIRELVSLAREVMADHAAAIACCTRLDGAGPVAIPADDAAEA